MKPCLSKTGKVEKLSISLPPEMADALRTMSALRFSTISQIVRDLIHQASAPEALIGRSMLRRTNAEKRAAVEQALRDYPEKSDQLIADHVGVSRDMAMATRRQVAGNTKLPPRGGKDGKVYYLAGSPAKCNTGYCTYE
jgi:hypothetical protein